MTDDIILQKKNSKDWRLLEFFVPIQEKLINEKDEFIIRGVAINETTTLNNVKYVAEELEKAAPSFRNVPILLDHRNEVKNIVGRTTEGVRWNPSFRRIEFEGRIMDKDIREMIKDGRIGSVSIGAKVQDLIKEDDGSERAIGIHGLEISLVAVAGDFGATFAHAVQNSIHLREMYQLNKKEKVEMAEEDQIKPSDTPEEAEEEVKEETKEEVPEEKASEEKVQNINVTVDNSEMTDLKIQIAELKELLIQKKEIKEQMENEKEDETKGEVSEDKEEALEKVESMIVERMGNKFGLYRDYTKEDVENTKLKRLVR